MDTVIDHLVVVAPSLAAGRAYVERALGVPLQPGGAHPRMGTHNLLASLGPSCYLEVIAIDPDAPTPPHPRWFALDTLAPDAEPHLAAWVARAADIQAASAGCDGAVGNVQSMSRGALRWQITITPDGSIPWGGAVPALIEWPLDSHPACHLAELGCRLSRLEVHHPQPKRVRTLHEAMRLVGPIDLITGPPERSALVARIDTPDGLRTIASR